MRPSGTPTALIDEVTRFQADVRRLALAAVRVIIEQELDRRLVKSEPAQKEKRKRQPTSLSRREPVRQLELGFAQAPERQLALALAPARPAESQPEPEAAGAPDPSDVAVERA